MTPSVADELAAMSPELQQKMLIPLVGKMLDMLAEIQGDLDAERKILLAISKRIGLQREDLTP